jgi:hypothetical protein
MGVWGETTCPPKYKSDINPYLILIAGAAMLWAIASVCFAAITEEESATDGGRNALAEVSAGLRLIREVSGF